MHGKITRLVLKWTNLQTDLPNTLKPKELKGHYYFFVMARLRENYNLSVFVPLGDLPSLTV